MQAETNPISLADIEKKEAEIVALEQAPRSVERSTNIMWTK